MLLSVIAFAVLLTLGSSFILVVVSLPSPIECSSHGCSLSNYQGTWTDRKPCKVAKVVYPATQEELVAAVVEVVKKQQKVKVGSESSHTISKFACPGGDAGLLISTRDYANNVIVNETTRTATVDAGVQLRYFVEEVARYGFTIPHTPLWDGVSMGGVIATGSHGSGFWLKGSSISEYVVGVTMVIPASAQEGYAKLVSLTEEDEDLKAARISLGVLGVISQVTFSLLPMFKRSTTLEMGEDDSLEDQIELIARSHDFPHVSWIPSANKVVFRKENHVPIETEGDGENKFPLILPMPVSAIEEMRSHQEIIEMSRDVEALCKAGEEIAWRRLNTGDGLLNDGFNFSGFPVVGFNHRMQSAGGCQEAVNPGETLLQITATGMELVPPHQDGGGDFRMKDWMTCKWDPRISGFFYFHTAIAIPLRKVTEFIVDVKKLREANPRGMCSLNLLGGIMIRFVSESEAYLGEREDSAVVELVYYRSKAANMPRLNEDVMEEVEQMLVLKYDGKPHWGKNRDVVFEGIGRKVRDLEKFLEVKQRFDPDGLFSSEWSDAVLGIGREVGIEEDYCGLEGLCICKEDRHCAPNKGYFCKQGMVYERARVCRYETLETTPPL